MFLNGPAPWAKGMLCIDPAPGGGGTLPEGPGPAKGSWAPGNGGTMDMGPLEGSDSKAGASVGLVWACGESTWESGTADGS